MSTTPATIQALCSYAYLHHLSLSRDNWIPIHSSPSSTMSGVDIHKPNDDDGVTEGDYVVHGL